MHVRKGSSQVSAMSRNKGKRGEREVGEILSAAGLSYLREQDGRTQGSDFRVEQFCIEARYRQKLEIPKWSVEVELKTPAHLVPVLAWRKNGHPWRASLPLRDLAELMKAAG